MKTKKIIPIILVVTLLLVIIIYGRNKNSKSNELNTLKTPSKINLYYNGESKEIAHNQDLFGDICELIVFQMPQIVVVDNFSTTSDTVVNEIKAYAVEFIYNKPQKIKVNDGGNVKRVQYTELLFPMSEKHEYKDNVYIKKTDNSYLFIGVRPNIKYLVKNIF